MMNETFGKEILLADLKKNRDYLRFEIKRLTRLIRIQSVSRVGFEISEDLGPSDLLEENTILKQLKWARLKNCRKLYKLEMVLETLDPRLI